LEFASYLSTTLVAARDLFLLDRLLLPAHLLVHLETVSVVIDGLPRAHGIKRYFANDSATVAPSNRRFLADRLNGKRIPASRLAATQSVNSRGGKRVRHAHQHTKETKMDLIVTDRESIQRGIIVRSNYVVISIRDPEKQPATVRKQSGLRDVLYLAFHDAEPTEGTPLPPDIVLMTSEHVRQIWEFVKKWEGQIGTIVVHCEQGMSRSPAVAAALCRRYGGDKDAYFRDYQPNRFVYQMMRGRGSTQALP
jgi:predicted protein tyrosine phosphatase